MKILYVGELYPDGWIPTTRMRMEELRRLGHEIISIDAIPYYEWGGRWVGGPFRRLQWGPPFWLFNRAILRQARLRRPEVLWVDKGTWVYPSTLRQVRALGARFLVHYTPDPALVRHRTRHFVGSIREYDLVVTTKAYEVEEYQRYGAKELLFQYPSYDRDVHQPCSPTSEERRRFAADAVFVGTYAAGREQFLKPLTTLDIDLAIWGSGWDRCPDAALQKHIRGGGIGGRDYALALGCAKIGLGLLSPLSPDRSTTRSLEIPACRTFLLGQRTDEHQALFKEGLEAEFFSSEEELCRKVRYFLDHETDRTRIAANGHARCLASGYSSGDRVRAIMNRLGELVEVNRDAGCLASKFA